jgi:HK97 family phage portal protein
MLTNPNPHMSAFSFWKSRIVNELLYGYSLSEITYVRGNPDAIWPIRPDTVTIDFRDSVRPFEIKVKGDKYYPPLSQVLYIPRFTLDGTTPISPTKKAEETIGLGLAAEKFEATVFSKGSYPSVLIKHAGRLSKEAKNNIREMWSEEQAGLQQAHAPAVIDEGMDVEKLSFSPQEAEMLGLREFQIREVSRFLGVPPHLLSDLTGATFSNVEQMGLEVLTWSVGPLLIAREQELQRKLLPKGDYLICFDTDGLTPQDRQTRYSTHRESLPWKTVNEVRREEGISELPFSKADAVPTTPGSEYIDDIPLSKDLVNWLQLYNSGKLSATQLQTLAEIAGLKIEADTWTKLLQKESVSDVRA